MQIIIFIFPIDFYDYNLNIFGGDDTVDSLSDTGSDAVNAQVCSLSATKMYSVTFLEVRNPCSGELIFEENFKRIYDFNSKKWTTLEKFQSEKVRNSRNLYTIKVMIIMHFFTFPKKNYSPRVSFNCQDVECLI